MTGVVLTNSEAAAALLAQEVRMADGYRAVLAGGHYLADWQRGSHP